MRSIPAEMVAVIAPFAPLFSQRRVWRTAQALLWGAILAHGRRTVTAALRALGRAHDPHVTTAHRLLNRVRWAPMLASARILLRLLVAAFVPAEAAVLVAVDDVVERRHSGRLFALGAYRDPVASSATHAVPCFGLRWVVASLCVAVPGARRVWALPFLTALCHPPRVKTRKSTSVSKTKVPARRARTRRGGLRARRLSTAQRPFVRAEGERRRQKPGQPRRHKTAIDVAAQVLSVLARWLPGRRVVAVADGAYFSYKLLRQARRVGVGLVTRGRWAMVLYREPEPRAAGARGAAPSRGARVGSVRQIGADPATGWEQVEVAWYGGRRKRFAVASGVGMWGSNNQAAVRLRWVISRDLEPDPRRRLREEVFVTTEVEARAGQVLEGYVGRWSTEVTFEEVRRHLGLETGRGWSRRTLERATPAQLGLFSIVTLVAVTGGGGGVAAQQAAWYRKPDVTFSDCLAAVRRRLWRARYLQALGQEAGGGTRAPDELERLLDALPLGA
jgi:hypothetical protein